MSNFDKEKVKAGISILQYLADQGVEVRNNRAVASWRGGKNPNVSVDDKKRVWRDFKEEESGDIFDLFMKIEGGNFKNALKTLGERYNIPQDDTPLAPSKPRQPSAVHLTDKELEEERRKNLDPRLRQFVPITLRNYAKTAFTGTTTADILAEAIRMSDADLHLDDRAYRLQAARQLRALFRPGEKVWAGWIIRDEAVRKPLGYRYAKTPLMPSPSLFFTDRDAYRLALKGIYEAHALADSIEKGNVAKIPTHVSLNPVTGEADENGKWDTSRTIAAFRHVLIEWDKLFDQVADGMKTPSQAHIDIIAGLLDYSAEINTFRPICAVYTGGKSIHVALRVKAADLTAYKKELGILRDIFASADDETFRADTNGWNIGYTHIRLAGAIRPETGRTAKALWLNP